MEPVLHFPPKLGFSSFILDYDWMASIPASQLGCCCFSMVMSIINVNKPGFCSLHFCTFSLYFDSLSCAERQEREACKWAPSRTGLDHGRLSTFRNTLFLLVTHPELVRHSLIRSDLLDRRNSCPWLQPADRHLEHFFRHRPESNPWFLLPFLNLLAHLNRGHELLDIRDSEREVALKPEPVLLLRYTNVGHLTTPLVLAGPLEPAKLNTLICRLETRILCLTGYHSQTLLTPWAHHPSQRQTLLRASF